MSTLPSLPDFDGVDVIARGRLVLQFVLEHSVTATLSLDDCDRGHYAATEALSRRNVVADETTPACVFDRLENARTELRRAAERRRQHVADVLARFGFTDVADAESVDSQRSTPASATAQLDASEVAALRALLKHLDDGTQGGTRVPVNPRPPTQPPAQGAQRAF